MKTMGKKLLSVLLALCLTAGLLPWGAVLAAGRTLDEYEGYFSIVEMYEMEETRSRDISRLKLPELPEGMTYYNASFVVRMFADNKNPDRKVGSGGMMLLLYPSATNDRAQAYGSVETLGAALSVEKSTGIMTNYTGGMSDREEEGVLSVRWAFANEPEMVVLTDENDNQYYDYEINLIGLAAKPGDRFPVEVGAYVSNGVNSIRYFGYNAARMTLTGDDTGAEIVIPGDPVIQPTQAESVTAPEITGMVGTEIAPVSAVQTGGTARGVFTAEGLAEGLSINPHTGAISGTPTAEADGTYTVTYTNDVGATVSEPAKITIEINKTAAESVTAPAITGVMGTEIAPVTVTQTGGTEGGVFSAEGLPAGLSIDGASGVISGMVEEVFAGTYTATYTNDAGVTVSEPASINIIDTDIAAESVAAADITGTAGTEIAPVTATQTGGTEGGVFSAEGLPRGLSIDGESGVISGTPAGMADTTYTVAYTTPGGKVTVSAPYTVKIAPDPSKKLGTYEGYFTTFDATATRSATEPTEEMRAAGLRYYNATVTYRLTFDDVDAEAERYPINGGVVLTLYPDASGRTAYANQAELAQKAVPSAAAGDIMLGYVGSMLDRTEDGIYSIRYGFNHTAYEDSLPDENGNRYYEYTVTFSDLVGKLGDTFPVDVGLWLDSKGISSIVYADNYGPCDTYMTQTTETSGGNILIGDGYTLTYRDGVSGAVFSDELHEGLNDGDVLPAFEGSTDREGYAFKGWNTAVDGTGTAYVPGTDVMPDGDLVLYAQWNKVHKVSFDANGGSGEMAALEIVEGESDVVPDNGFTVPEKKKFNGWNTAADGTGDDYAAGDSITPTEDMVLYAQWLNIYTVSFNANGGGGEMAALEIEDGESGVVPENGFTVPEKKKFNGWNTELDGSGMAYAPGDEITPTEDMVLYAQWLNIYTVSFNANGGSGEMAALEIVEGESDVVPANGFTVPEKKKFNGWNTELDGSGMAYAPGDEITPTEDMVLYAQWLNIYTVSFNANGGSGEIDALEIVEGESGVVPVNSFELPDENKKFNGWNTAPDGSGTAYAPGDPITPTEDMVLYAQWLDIYTVSFRANGGSGEMEDLKIVAGESDKAPDCGFTPPVGKKFKIWNDAMDGTGTAYAPGDDITPTEDMVLYAQWEDETIVFVRDGEKLNAIKILRWVGMDHANSGEPKNYGYDPTMIKDTVEVRGSDGELMEYSEWNAATVRKLLSEAVYERFTRGGMVALTYAEDAAGVITLSDISGDYLAVEIKESTTGKLYLEITSKNSAAVRMTLASGYQFMVVTPGDADLNSLVDSNDWGLVLRWTLEVMAKHDKVDFAIEVNGEDYDLWMLMADMNSLELTGNRRTNVDANDWKILMYLTLEGWKS